MHCAKKPVGLCLPWPVGRRVWRALTLDRALFV